MFNLLHDSINDEFGVANKISPNCLQITQFNSTLEIHNFNIFRQRH